jgi:small subunit ribosomal protein S2
MKDKDKIIEELFQAKVHLGHKKNRVHPAAKKYIYGFDKGISIIDLEATYNKINQLREVIAKLKKDKKIILFVSTKKIINNLVQNIAKKLNFPYLTSKWPNGLITNFEVVYKNVEKLKKMSEEKENNLWQQYQKHEQLKLEKKLKKLQQIYGGIINLEKIPDALFIVDFHREKNALIEAKKRGIITMGICDTNINPDQIDYPVIGNDDLYSSVECLLNKIFQ